MLVKAIDPDGHSVRYLHGVAAVRVPLVAEAISRSLGVGSDAGSDGRRNTCLQSNCRSLETSTELAVKPGGLDCQIPLSEAALRLQSEQSGSKVQFVRDSRAMRQRKAKPRITSAILGSEVGLGPSSRRLKLI